MIKIDEHTISVVVEHLNQRISQYHAQLGRPVFRHLPIEKVVLIKKGEEPEGAYRTLAVVPPYYDKDSDNFVMVQENLEHQIRNLTQEQFSFPMSNDTITAVLLGIFFMKYGVISRSCREKTVAGETKSHYLDFLRDLTSQNGYVAARFEHRDLEMRSLGLTLSLYDSLGNLIDNEIRRNTFALDSKVVEWMTIDLMGLGSVCPNPLTGQKVSPSYPDFLQDFVNGTIPDRASQRIQGAGGSEATIQELRGAVGIHLRGEHERFADFFHALYGN